MIPEIEKPKVSEPDTPKPTKTKEIITVLGEYVLQVTC